MKKDLVLEIPPGVFLFNNPRTVSNTFDFLNNGSSLSIIGHRDASVFKCDGLGGTTSLASFANMLTFELDGLAFWGVAQNRSVPNIAGLFEINAQYGARVANVTALGFVTSSYLFLTLCPTKLEHIFTADCAAIDASFGLLATLHAVAVTFEHIAMVDGAGLNDVSPPALTDLNTSSIRVNGPASSVLFRNVFVDEACQTNISLDGQNGRIELVTAEGLRLNPPTLAPGVAGIRANKVDALT